MTSRLFEISLIRIVESAAAADMIVHGATIAAIFVAILSALEDCARIADGYVLPTPTFEILQPPGIRISIPQEDENCPTFVTWKRYATVKDMNYLIIPIPYVMIGATFDVPCYDRAQCRARVENIYSYDVNIRGLNDIAYSFLIGGDGSVFEGCGWDREGMHTPNYNKKSIGIGFIGGPIQSQKMYDAAYKLILCGKSQGILRDNVRVIEEREFGGTRSLVSDGIEPWFEGISFRFNTAP